jgi:electron-transferring-flavoprotein dehydrogenase
MQFDVVIVGAGPAGLSGAIRLAQLARESSCDISICVVEKGSEVGAHILSGAILEPRCLDQLVPDWKARGAPLHTQVRSEHFQFLTRRRAFRLPIPPAMNNQGNYIISLGSLCRWLAQQAESMGVEIFPGFAATEILYDESGKVRGVATGDMGIGSDGIPTDNFQAGVELVARQTLLAEGCRGSLSQQLMQRFNLRQGVDPQTYGLKELWEIDPANHRQGTVVHTIGWPLDNTTYGGSFIYHLQNNLVAVGLVIGLDYKNPHLSPFDEFQRFKTHPAVRKIFSNGRRISYGARAISEGGLQSLPRLTFPGGCLIGDSAGFLNVAKIKGIHGAMKSAMLAAEAVFENLDKDPSPDEATAYTERFRQSWLYQELHSVRNIRPGFHKGLWRGLINASLETWIRRGSGKTLRQHADHSQLGTAPDHPKIDYPKPDGEISFDLMSSVYLSATHHQENQPAHLLLADPEVPVRVNLAEYDAPEQRYCPAGVYEIIQTPGESPVLRINAQNCLHCKTCDIKDPEQNITWVAPEGGGGPNYPNM